MIYYGRGRPRPLTTFVLALGVLQLADLHAQTAIAQSARPLPAGIASKCDPSRALGVSRIIEIDTATGPRFGHQQYKELDLLTEGEVILTFDDGPLRHHTQAVVDALDTHCTKGTFFMVGSQALADPDMVKQIMRRGHTVGTHTWSHSNLRQMAPLAARQELELGFSAVTLAAGQPIAPFFRFPFLADSKAMKSYGETRQLGVFSIDVDALDYRHKDNPQAVRDEILNQLAAQRKGILLFHDIQPSTAQALPSILAALKAKGFKIVHVRPKSTATTLPEFDAMAQREMARKRIASAGNPLASRAVTWQVPARSTQPGGASGVPVPNGVAAGPPGRPPVGVNAPGSLPPIATAGQPFPAYQPPVFAPPSQAAPPPIRLQRPRPDDDWRSRVYNIN